MRLRALDTKLSQFLGSQAAGDTDVTHKPGGRLPLLSSSPAVTFPAKEITPMAGTKLYRLVTDAHGLSKASTQWCPAKTRTCDP